jgi:hypothetical protein
MKNQLVLTSLYHRQFTTLEPEILSIPQSNPKKFCKEMMTTHWITHYRYVPTIPGFFRWHISPPSKLPHEWVLLLTHTQPLCPNNAEFISTHPNCRKKCCHNHEENKTKFITCKQQNNAKIERTTNEAQWLLQCLMMINCPLLRHFLSVQNIIAFHPLGHFFIQTFILAFIPKKNWHIFKLHSIQCVELISSKEMLVCCIFLHKCFWTTSSFGRNFLGCNLHFFIKQNIQ